MKKELRQKIILKRKNFLPTLIILFLLLASLTMIIYFTEPNGFFILLFFLNLFLFLFLISALILANSRRGVLVSLCLVAFLLFKMYGVGNILNLLLLLGLVIIIEIYARFKK